MSSHQIELFYWDKLWMSTRIFLWWLFHNWRGQKGLFEKLSLEPSTPILKVLWKCNSKLINPWFKEFVIWSTNNTQIDMVLYFYHLSAGYCNDIVMRISVLVSYGHLWSFHSSTYPYFLNVPLLLTFTDAFTSWCQQVGNMAFEDPDTLPVQV